MSEVRSEEMPNDDTIACSFCGHQDGIEDDKTVIIVGTMGANICEHCIKTCVEALLNSREPIPIENTPVE